MSSRPLSEMTLRLIRAMKEKGIRTAEELASIVGVTPGAARHWINGHREIKPQRFMEISTKLGYAYNIFTQQVPVNETSPRDEQRAGLLQKADVVLDSGTHFAMSLTMNIESFYAAVSREQSWESRFVALETACRRVEKLLDNEQNRASPFQDGEEGPGHSTPSRKRRPPRRII